MATGTNGYGVAIIGPGQVTNLAGGTISGTVAAVTLAAGHTKECGLV